MAQPTIQTFGKYQILERIATGSTAEIYKARLEGVGGFQRTFAIKRVLPNLSRNDEYVAMLVEEAKVAGLLSHANIVQIVDLGQVDDLWYIAMEYVDGRDLGAVLDRGRRKRAPLPVPHSVFVAIELLKGLEYAHTREVMQGGRAVKLDIIHRDVSPPNVLISFQGEVKLTDFGIARASLKAMGTVSGQTRGRYDYTSPEQATGGSDLDQRSDLFSVGVLLYEMLTGHHPFRGDSEAETIARVKSGKYAPVSQLRPDVSDALAAVVDRALAVDRRRRFATATDFKEALDQFFHDSGFIFTHTTLANYMQGLFPEHGASAPGSALDDADTSANLSMLRESPPPPLQDHRASPFSERFDDLADEGDQDTLIRRMPEGWDDSPEPADEVAPEPPRSGGSAPRVPAPNLAPQRAPTTGRTSSVRRHVVQGGARPNNPMVGWAVGLMAGLFGVGIGVSLTTLVLLMSGVQLVGRDEPVVAAPRITVVGPPSAVVRIDGERVGPNVQVSHGVPHSIDVRLGGRVVFTEELVLNRGEHRVVILSAASGDGG